MSIVEMGMSLPAICLPATGEQQIDLATLKGQNVVLYFYPRDNTPGCTQEGQDFRDLQQQFIAHNTLVLGVSRDTVRKHENFKQKYEFNFDLLADTEETLCQAFDVIQPKMMFGKKVTGIVRSTFLFDKNSQLVQMWSKVKVTDHASEVLNAVKKLENNHE